MYISYTNSLVCSKNFATPARDMNMIMTEVEFQFKGNDQATHKWIKASSLNIHVNTLTLFIGSRKQLKRTHKI